MKVLDQEIDLLFVQESFAVSVTTACLLLILEWSCWDAQWSQRWKSDKGARRLYLKALASNFLHYAVIAPLGLGVCRAYIIWADNFYPSYIAVPGVLVLQGIMFSAVHEWFHVPSNYWIHKYHHTFNAQTFVRPICANAVTVLEFAIAYLLPVLLGILIFRPSPDAMYRIVTCISAANLVIHTPASLIPMHLLSLPDCMNSNKKHFHHHEVNVLKSTSGPIFDFGTILFDGEAGEEGEGK